MRSTGYLHCPGVPRRENPKVKKSTPDKASLFFLGCREGIYERRASQVRRVSRPRGAHHDWRLRSCRWQSSITRAVDGPIGSCHRQLPNVYQLISIGWWWMDSVFHGMRMFEVWIVNCGYRKLHTSLCNALRKDPSRDRESAWASGFFLALVLPPRLLISRAPLRGFFFLTVFFFTVLRLFPPRLHPSGTARRSLNRGSAVTSHP
jgi:hypothetical protein